MTDHFGKYDVYAVAGSIYCYRNTSVLKNKFGIKDPVQLKELEADTTAVRQNELFSKPISGRFTVNHLCRIHKHLFGDVYSFAGHFRREDIMKGTTRFLSHKEIKLKLSALLNELNLENYMQGLSESELIVRSAYYLAELNYIHPFREGNGRALREFMRLLYDANGYEVHWDAVSSEIMLQAMELSVFRTGLLEQILADCVKKK